MLGRLKRASSWARGSGSMGARENPILGFRVKVEVLFNCEARNPESSIDLAGIECASSLTA